MKIVPEFWSRSGCVIPYNGLRQTGNTCVLLSVASAVNWLTHSSLSEIELVKAFLASGQQTYTFGSVSNFILGQYPDCSLQFTEYDDRFNPIVNVSDLLVQARFGGVLILSLQMVGSPATSYRFEGWHMISVFNNNTCNAQVWDTNGYEGFLTWEEVGEILTGSPIVLKYREEKLLCPHDQRNCLIITRR